MGGDELGKRARPHLNVLIAVLVGLVIGSGLADLIARLCYQP